SRLDTSTDVVPAEDVRKDRDEHPDEHEPEEEDDHRPDDAPQRPFGRDQSHSNPSLVWSRNRRPSACRSLDGASYGNGWVRAQPEGVGSGASGAGEADACFEAI